MDDWQRRFESELRRGEQARQDGNEGMARVCARRAAGAVVSEYLRRQARSDPLSPRERMGEGAPRGSAYDNLRRLAARPGISAEVLALAEHLLARITPEHTLPFDADLLAEAQRLKELLLE